MRAVFEHPVGGLAWRKAPICLHSRSSVSEVADAGLGLVVSLRGLAVSLKVPSEALGPEEVFMAARKNIQKHLGRQASPRPPYHAVCRQAPRHLGELW